MALEIPLEVAKPGKPKVLKSPDYRRGSNITGARSAECYQFGILQASFDHLPSAVCERDLAENDHLFQARKVLGRYIKRQGLRWLGCSALTIKGIPGTRSDTLPVPIEMASLCRV